MVDKSSIYPDNNAQKPINQNTVHIEKTVAETFHLPNYMDVYVTKIDKREVELDSVEVTFKEQYVGRSEMWRLVKSLNNTCVYMHKKVDLCKEQVCYLDFFTIYLTIEEGKKQSFPSIKMSKELKSTRLVVFAMYMYANTL